MTWRNTETEEGQDIVYDGMEFGIAPSPTKGTANIQNANIATLSGEVLASYNRVAQQQTALASQTLTPNGATDFTGPSTLKAGTWINVTASTVTSITAATNPSSVTADYLVVAGGGGGGGARDSASSGGGGGGAGAVRTGTNSFSVGSTAITVGSGGSGAATVTSKGSNGSDSILGAVVTATGGGGGGTGVSGVSPSSTYNGSSGGSGGGGGSDGSTTGTKGTGTTGGNNGGDSIAAATAAGGGGGGANATGANATSGNGGAGGAGIASSITGVSTTYGGGGGGGNGGAGGTGGGGNGGGTNTAGSDATAYTGGGGGGASDSANVFREGGDGGSGIVVISYTTGAMFATGGNVYQYGGKTIHVFKQNGVFTVHSIPTGGLYYVSYKSGTTFRLSSKFDPTGANTLTHGTTGSITFSTVTVPNSMVAKAVEKYTTSSATKYRYYLLDINGYVWLWDTAIYETYGTQWMLPDPTSYSVQKLTGMAVLNGWLLTVGIGSIYGKPTVNLGVNFAQLTNVYLNEPFPNHRNYAIAAQQGKMYYCDGNYIGEVFPTTSLVTSIANIQSYCSYTASTTTGTISAVISGSLPTSGNVFSTSDTRIPVQFFTDVYGTLPTAITPDTIYYLLYNPFSSTFTAYASDVTSTAIDLSTGAVGNQYFNTFFPTGSSMSLGSSTATIQFSPQRVNLPTNETTQCLVEVGNTVLIGGTTNIVYPWNQIDATPSDFIALPEADVKTMVNVNNMAYIFAGNKGNIYISNGSVASLALKVPDYCAGVPGTPLTYIEPVFTWGDADYMRGRVYFSILDQTATKAGNCGGIWSFIPSQNIDPSQEVGLALRLENQQSYGDYDGYATIILPNQEQTVTSPQYWAAWQDNYSTGTSAFGIDYTGTVPVTTFVVETDLIPTGSLLSKDTYTQLEYKLSTPAQSGDSVQLYYRLDSTSAWTSCGTANTETAFPISGYYEMEFQKTQWLQLRAVMTTSGTTASSFCRLAQIMLR